LKNEFLIIYLVGLLSYLSDKVTEKYIDNSHNSRNSIEWVGIYNGIIPCGDCEVIQISVIINQDNTIEILRRYLGKMSVNLNRMGILYGMMKVQL